MFVCGDAEGPEALVLAFVGVINEALVWRSEMVLLGGSKMGGSEMMLLG